MVAKGSPKLNMLARGSPKFQRLMATTNGTKKKTAGSPKVKKRASWNHALEKSLVDILHEYKDAGFRGDNGCWNSEGWNRMVKEFHVRNKYVSFTKAQIQDKECLVKRDYRMLKEARKQSGASWNNDRNMVQASPDLWEKLIVSYPKIKKFQGNKATFPLFDQLGELYDGHLAEGAHNFVSLPSPQEEEPLQQIHDVEDDKEDGDEVQGEDGDRTSERNVDVLETRADTLSRDKESVDAGAGQSGQRRTAAVAAADARKKEDQEGKRPKRSSNIQNMMERYMEMRTKQAEEESAQLAKEKEADYSVKRCISVLSRMEVTKAEKAKAFSIFKTLENRQIFICAVEDDPESALIWLRSEME